MGEDAPVFRLSSDLLTEMETRATEWLSSHLPHYMTEPDCVPCRMATDVLMLVKNHRELKEEVLDLEHRLARQFPPQRRGNR